jgi:predicted phosphodiesterase
MKISICSDIHLEFGDLDFDNTESAQVLILSGDICVARDIAQRDPYGVMGPEYRSNRYHEFFQRCAARFEHVVYIVGNHEHYHHDFAKTVLHLQDVLSYLPNLHVLEKDLLDVGDVTFLAGTLWTNMNQEDPHTLYSIRNYMNDFRCITNSTREVHFRDDDGKFHTRVARFTPEDTVEEHKAMLEFVNSAIAARPDRQYVVVGHHAPSRLSTHAQYADEHMVNGAYSSDLNEFIQDHPQIRLWTHGHTHHNFDYMIGQTRVVCNPRGYHGHEQQAADWQLQTVEV